MSSDSPRANHRPPRFFRRSTTDRQLGGVAGGVAERLATDPTYVRIGLVAATLYLAYARGGAHGLVLVPYALLWVLVPTESGPSLVSRLDEAAARWELLLAVVAFTTAVALFDRPSSIVVLLLGGLAVALLRDRTPAPPFPQTVAGTGPRVHDETPVAADPAQGLRPPPPARPRRPRREPALWPLALGLLTAVAVAAIAMDQATDGGVDPRIAIDIALLLLGGVLVLSAWRGRARTTILGILALVPLWAATSVPDVGRFAGEGTKHLRPMALPASTGDDGVASLSYEVGYGTLEVDLRELPLDDGSTTTVEVGVTAGRADVVVPAGVHVEVDGRIGLGDLEVTAPRHYRSSTVASLSNHIDRRFPALGRECDEVSVSDEELVEMARRAGLEPVEVGAPGSVDEIADVIEAAGYQRPSVDWVEEIPMDQGPGYDEFGDPVTTTVTEPAHPRTYWLVQVEREDYLDLCRPLPPPDDPPTIIIEPTIGLGTLEIRRV